MCIEQTQLAVIDDQLIEQEECATDFVDEVLIDQFEDTQADVERLEVELEFVQARIQETMFKLSADTKDIELQIIALKQELMDLQTQFEESDDFFEQENAKDIEALRRQIFPDDFDDEQSDVAYDENELSSEETAEEKTVTEIRRQCKLLYKKIANRTHPDKVKKYDDLRKEQYRKIFIRAKDAYEDGDLDQLVKIHEELFGTPTKQVNLMERLIAARQRREELRYLIGELKQSGPWGMHQVEVTHGYNVALDAYKESLTNTLNHLKQLIAQETDY